MERMNATFGDEVKITDPLKVRGTTRNGALACGLLSFHSVWDFPKRVIAECHASRICGVESSQEHSVGKEAEADPGRIAAPFPLPE